MSTRPPVREDLEDVTPYGAPQLDVPIRLNTNETPWSPPQSFHDELARRVAEQLPLHRYPDRDAVELRQALADREKLPLEQVWLANGSNEILSQLFAAYGGNGRTVLFPSPGYSAHPLLATVTGTDVAFFDLAADFSLTPEAAADAVSRASPAIVCLASPNNPTGLTVDAATVEAIHDAFHGLVVLDEAYVELAADPGQGRALLDRLDRLVVVRTFSKAWRLAGLRLGYLLAPSWVVEDILKVRLPYHLDVLTQTAGLVALELADEVTSQVKVLVSERARMQHAIQTLPDVTVWPSSGNFLLFRVEVPGVTAADVFDHVLAAGILVRDFSSKPRLEGCLRVSVGTPEENDAFLRALGSAIAPRT